MSQRYLRFIAAAALLAGILPAVQAAPPNTLGYQGRLTQNGAPVINTVAVTFKLYAVASGGTALWAENQTISPSNGLYSAILGQGVAFPAALFDQPLWLGVTLGSDPEMTPRQQLTSTPYSQQAKVATTATTATTASTAGALSVTPSTCAAGQYARGISANGNAAGCTAASGSLPTCSNGQVLKYSGSSWSCGADLDTNSGGTVTSITAGNGLTGGTITSSGTIAVDPNSAALTGNFAKQGGNTLGAPLVLGTSDNQAVEINANSARVMRFEYTMLYPNVIGGHQNNKVAAGSYGATIAGGGAPGTSCLEPSTGAYTRSCGNHANNHHATVSGGYANTADGQYSTVGGGEFNSAVGIDSVVAGGRNNAASGSYSAVGGGHGNTAGNGYSTVAGGFGNTASGNSSTVSGGGVNTASGLNSTVAGGAYSTASSDYSLAAGFHAKAIHAGAFVWADWTNADFSSVAANEFAVRASGGARFEGGSAIALKGNTGDAIAVYGVNVSTSAPSVEGWNQGTGAIIRGWSGASGAHTLKFDLQNNGNLWIAGTLTQASDGRLKTEVAPLPGALDKLTRLRGVRYLMKEGNDATPHIGVIAQELEREYPELVATDAAGMKSVAYANLTAVLIEAVKTLKAENTELKSRLAAVEQTQRDELAALKRSLTELKADLGGRAPEGPLALQGVR